MDATQAAHAQEAPAHMRAQYSTSHQSGLKHLESIKWDISTDGGQQLTNRVCVTEQKELSASRASLSNTLHGFRLGQHCCET